MGKSRAVDSRGVPWVEIFERDVLDVLAEVTRAHNAAGNGGQIRRGPQYFRREIADNGRDVRHTENMEEHYFGGFYDNEA